MHVIDFHAHVFPDKLAERAVSRLKSVAEVLNRTDGTLEDTCLKMRGWGVDRFVQLNVVTNPERQAAANDHAISLRAHPQVIPFGSAHPGDADTALMELSRIHEAGLKGIKLHPDYQNFFLDDPGAWRIYERCEALGLAIVFHMGFDPLSPDIVHGEVTSLLRVLDAFPKLKVVAAHLGGMYRWDEVERHLVGRRVWLDTAMLAGYCPPEQVRRIIMAHEHVLFGSDCPWHSPMEEMLFLKTLELPERRYEAIFYTNARALLT
ncbi:amidohydrolase family protein [Oscillospiraceae bacterium OttesenSCG-928-F05]|nr:amidohydrolase family protein [Oscillospiraceae bacterium OttesenSCG-928-F05]